MKKKGFTLIELLAVIIVLGVIALITTPIVMNSINDARRKSMENSALGIIRAIDVRRMRKDVAKRSIDYKINVGIDSTAIEYSGQLPDEGWAHIDEDGYITLYMKNENYCVYRDKSVAGNDDIVITDHPEDCNQKIGEIRDNATYAEIKENTIIDGEPVVPSIPEPVAFATDSWETINKAAKSNNYSVYNVGDTKEVTMDVNDDGTDETYHIMVVNTTACTTETSETACGLVLQFEEILNITNDENKKMNSTDTNAGGWPESAMRTYLNGTIYNKLKAVIGDIIVETTAISGHEYGVSTNYTSQDKLYLLSAKEVGFDDDFDSAKEETRKLDYYSDNRSRHKYNNHTAGMISTASWWLRSVWNETSSYFYSVGHDGGIVYEKASVTKDLAPAFRVGK